MNVLGLRLALGRIRTTANRLSLPRLANRAHDGFPVEASLDPGDVERGVIGGDRTELEHTAIPPWGRAFSRAEGEASPEPWVEPWLEDLRATGLLRRLAPGPDEGEELLANALAVLRTLPAGGVDLPRLAAEVVGDSQPVGVVGTRLDQALKVPIGQLEVDPSQLAGEVGAPAAVVRVDAESGKVIGLADGREESGSDGGMAHGVHRPGLEGPSRWGSAPARRIPVSASRSSSSDSSG